MHLKSRLAEVVREEIISGRLAPGCGIVETKWAGKLGVAQASLREAINILTAEGFVRKESGRTAHVTMLTEDDVRQIYELRVAVESFSARLLVDRRVDLGELEEVLADMRSAAERRNVRAYYERDLRFHLLMSEKCGNRFAAQALKPLLAPLFAFCVLRVQTLPPAPFSVSLNEHWQILEALRCGDPDVAASVVGRILRVSMPKRPICSLLNTSKHRPHFSLRELKSENQSVVLVN
jgi:DNA-binding GntR family transcriptional regulator